MAYRFTNTEKWGDSWFTSLKPIDMLLFMYLCDNCDIAGFIEVNHKRWATDLNTTIDKIQGACKGLGRGLVESKDGSCFFIRNFLKHQKNLPLRENNKAHQGIIKRFLLYKQKFDFEDYNEFITSPFQGAKKGLPSPTGNGNGIGNGNNSIEIEIEKKEKEKEKEKEKNLESDFEEFRSAYPGRKRGKEVEFDHLKKKHRDWKDVIPILKTVLTQQFYAKNENISNGHFEPEWQNLETYINKRSWEIEIDIKPPKQAHNNGKSNLTDDIEAVRKIINERHPVG